MAFVSPSMALKIWNSSSDPYSHEQLADNFIKIDLHDHSSNKGVQIGSTGIANGAIQPQHLSADLNSTPLYNGWRTIAERFGSSLTSMGAGTYPLGLGAGLNTAATAGLAFYLDPADYPTPAGSSMVRQIRLNGAAFTNSTAAPGVDFTFELRPLSLVQAANTSPTLGGGAVTTSVILPSPAMNQIAPRVQSTAVSFPTAGWYALFVTTTAAAAANSNTALRSTLQVRIA